MSALGSLPLVKWAMRLRRGRVELAGHLVDAVRLPLGEEASVAISAGPVAAEVEFVGGAVPMLSRVCIVAEGLAVGTAAGRSLEIAAGAVLVDGVAVEIPEPPLGTVAEALLEKLGDVAVSATAEPDGDIALRIGHGIEVIVPNGVPLTVRGASHGDASALRLSEPLVVGFGGEGLRLSHEQFRWLARLSVVRLGRATLHPDGSVALEGRGGRTAELAMRAPLQKASARLSDLVRRSPGFHRVRAFLKHGDPR